MIFTPDHIEDILAGRKTMTRRVCKPGEWRAAPAPDGVAMLSGRIKWEVGKTYAVQPGRGKPGAWIDAGGKLLLNPRGVYERRYERPADTQAMLDMHWQPLRIRITEIHQERLQDISEKDAVAEGCRATWGPIDFKGDLPAGVEWSIGVVESGRDKYLALWDSINTRPGTRWADNPSVWCLSFKVLS